MVARWHLGPITGAYFWWALLTSPEVLVFLFFMITDPRTSPRGQRERAVYAVSVGLLAALLIAPMRSEYAHKVALLGALALVCAARPLLALVLLRLGRRRLAVLAVAALAAYAGALVATGLSTRLATRAAAPLRPGELPAITIVPNHGVESKLTLATARQIAHGLVADKRVHAHTGETVRIHLEPGQGQDPPFAVAQLAGRTYHLAQDKATWVLTSAAVPRATHLPKVPTIHGYALQNVAAQVGLDFRQGSFRYGVTSDPAAMMGGGLCWLDYNNDGWLDLFVVNSYGEGDIGAYSAHGGLPRTALFRNDRGRFVNVTSSSHAGRAVRGEGCVAADFNGDGNIDLFITTAQDDELLWNNGDGTFTEGARPHGIVSYGWHSGAAVAEVNGDGRPDLFVAGYTEANAPIAGSAAGYPTNHLGVRDLLFLNQGNGPDGRARFREAGRAAGIDPKPYDHSLGAVFTDVNGDGRLDLYVANDEDPNRLYINKPGGPLGFHFVERGSAYGVDDANAGMGIAAADFNGDGRSDLFISNSRAQTNAVYMSRAHAFADARSDLLRTGTNATGWGDTWVDLRNFGQLDLVLANGAIPVKNLKRDADRLQVLVPSDNGFVDAGLVQGLHTNGRGLAAADYDNDGRVDIAVNTIGGRLLLLHNTSPSGHWLEVQVEPFSPGAVVSLTDSDGRRYVQEIHAGSSYLSSEDPRVHFGLGKSTARTLTVRYPDRTTKTYRAVPTDRSFTARR